MPFVPPVELNSGDKSIVYEVKSDWLNVFHNASKTITLDCLKAAKVGYEFALVNVMDVNDKEWCNVILKKDMC